MFSEDRLNPIKTERWLSIDPGDSHCGVAEWRTDTIVSAGEVSPLELINLLDREAGSDDIALVVCERWSLHAWQSASLSGNEFLTSQLIGVVKHLCARSAVPYVGQFNSEGKATYKRSPWDTWTIKDWRAAGSGRIRNKHVKDAMCHGYAYLWKWGWRP